MVGECSSKKVPILWKVQQHGPKPRHQTSTSLAKTVLLFPKVTRPISDRSVRSKLPRTHFDSSANSAGAARQSWKYLVTNTKSSSPPKGVSTRDVSARSRRKWKSAPLTSSEGSVIQTEH